VSFVAMGIEHIIGGIDHLMFRSPVGAGARALADRAIVTPLRWPIA